jgi:hypothetical protein
MTRRTMLRVSLWGGCALLVAPAAARVADAQVTLEITGMT